MSNLSQDENITHFENITLVRQENSKDAESYQYLAESIRIHPNQERLQVMMQTAGFEKVEYFNRLAGIGALHFLIN